MIKFSTVLLLLFTPCTLAVECPENINTNLTAEVLYDLCIIGAGCFGSAAAKYASAYKHLKICIIGLDEPSSEKEYEKRDIFSSHYDSGRIVKHMFEFPAYQKLVQASIKQFRPLENQSGIDFYDPVGYLQIGNKNTYSMKRLEDVSAAVQTPLRTIDDQRSMNETFPFIYMQDSQYALHDYSGTGVINPRKMIQARLKVAQQQGCCIIFDEVENVEPLRDNYHIIGTTHHGNIKAKRVLFTTGGFTNANKFQVLPRFKVAVQKEYAALVRIPEGEANRLRDMPSMEYETDDLARYIVAPVMYPDGQFYIKIGLIRPVFESLQTKEEIKEVYLSNETNEEAVSIAEFLFEIIPGLNSDGISHKTCILSFTPTRYPYIDRLTSTITVAIFGNGWGATTSEEIGRLAALLSLFGNWDSEIPKSLFEIVTETDCLNT